MQADIAIELEISGDQESFWILDGQSRICNSLFNELMSRANELKIAFKQTGDEFFSKMLYTKYGLRNLIPEIKKENPFYNLVHSSPLKNTALRLTASIQAYQKCRKGKRKGTAGWPSFRSWKKSWFSLLYDEPKKGFKVEGATLHLSLGRKAHGERQYLSFHLREASRLAGYTTRNLRLVRKAGKYYAIFSVQRSVPEKKPVKKIIALDPNHKNFAVGVDTDGKSIEIQRPYWIKQSEKRIDELKSKRDRCKKDARKVEVLDDQGKPTGKTYTIPSRRYRKLDRVLEVALHKRREQTKTFMFTVAHMLCKHYDCIGIGDYAPHGTGLTKAMRRAMNNESLIGRFKDVLYWTTMKSGKHCIQYNEKGTTRTCHVCGCEVSGGLPPSVRQWTCPACQEFHIRDENAAQNGLAKILRDLNEKRELYGSQVPSSGLVSIEERWAWRVLPSGVLCTRSEGKTASDRKRQEIKMKA
jgi:putative transposase